MSGRKNVLVPTSVITSGDMSQATVTSLTTNVQYMDNVSYEAAWTGTPTGVLVIQGSHTGVNWNTIVTASPAPSGSAGSQLFDLNQLSFPLVRMLYTRTSGSGTLNATVSVKEV